MGFRYIYIILLCIICAACEDPPPVDDGSLLDIAYDPIPYEIDIPPSFPQMVIPEDNPMTQQGIDLGRRLFYDPILSRDSMVSCSTCHLPSGSFTDNLESSIGVNGALGERSSMSLLNVGFTRNGLFWDGNAMTLEDQALLPVTNENEFDNEWPEVVKRLKRSVEYPRLFREAFGISNVSEINEDYAVKAIAQFERILVSSGKSKYDRVEAGLDAYTDQELLGRDLFFDDNTEVPDAECNHCHSVPIISADQYFNNGLDAAMGFDDFEDLGRGGVTGIFADNGKFKAPSLRNILFSAPYMHDGRFKTLKEVIEHYNSGGKESMNKDPLIRPLNLTNEQIDALVAFISTMSDTDFIEDERYSDPFQ